MNTSLQHIPIKYDVLLDANRHYRSAKDRISREVKKGEYLRLRHGLYYIAEDARDISIEKKWLIANHIYGPSYVSSQSVLAYHGVIPEAVATVTSAVIHRAKSFETLVGEFSYIKVPRSYFSVGLSITSNNAIAATVAKALCDMVACKRSGRIQSVKAMLQYLLDDLRLDIDALFTTQPRELVLATVREASTCGLKTAELEVLAKTLERI
jgi:hypothetical protein